jgi:large subunit ribosomal protein L24
MEKEFSTSWKASKRPGKQRKYRHNAPLHITQKFLSAHLSKELRKKYGKRSLTVVKGDRVKVVRGQFKGRENKVESTDHKKTLVYVAGLERTKKDGSKSLCPVHPSNLIITELNLADKMRKEKLESPRPAAAAKEGK